MNAQSLNVRLTPLFDAHKQTVHLIHRLSKLQSKPVTGSTNSSDSSEARVELSAEIHQSLKEQEEEFELLRQGFEDLNNNGSWARKRDTERDQENIALAAQITRLEEDLKSARTQFRKAQLQAKRNAEAAKRKERELLFEGIQEGSNPANPGWRKGQEKLTQDELLLNASNDVTAALRRTHSLMQAEVSRSQFANETLQQSTAALSTLSESYTNLDSLLASSRSLVSSLVHSQKSDTWYLESAFWILVSTIIWLVFRRLIYGPGWWLLYLPTKLTWRLTISLIQLFFGSIASVSGAIGITNQRSVISEIQENFSTSLILKPSATGGPPKIPQGMSAPSIAVGGGGEGAKTQQNQVPQAVDRSMVEDIGRLAEESRQGEGPNAQSPGAATQQGTRLRERSIDEPPNPKKRMWEENIDPPPEERPRDEL